VHPWSNVTSLTLKTCFYYFTTTYYFRGINKKQLNLRIPPVPWQMILEWLLPDNQGLYHLNVGRQPGDLKINIFFIKFLGYIIYLFRFLIFIQYFKRLTCSRVDYITLKGVSKHF